MLDKKILRLLEMAKQIAEDVRADHTIQRTDPIDPGPIEECDFCNYAAKFIEEVDAVLAEIENVA